MTDSPVETGAKERLFSETSKVPLQKSDDFMLAERLAERLAESVPADCSEEEERTESGGGVAKTAGLFCECGGNDVILPRGYPQIQSL